jgi:NADPH-dependent 2,4-dienoyl-CoA reductase/sulfur reductase-like enzyme
VSSVWLSNGAKLLADIVVVGIGIKPAVQLASAAGLEVDNGVVTNQFCQTSNSRVYAIGDCARNLNIRYNNLIRLESWQNAEQQADIAASHLTGTQSPLQSVPWFWSDQYRYNIQMAGFPLEADDLVVRGSLNCGAVVYLGIKDGLLVGAVAIGEGTSAVRDLRVSQMLIEQRRPVDVSVLDDPDIKLKSLLK